MTTPISNARMYSVTPDVESSWRVLIDHVANDAMVELQYVPYPAPLPLEDLWQRTDLGCVLMCGYPIAMQLAPVIPLAAPIPSMRWAEGRPVYRSDLIVREDSPFETLSDTFGHRAAWTVAHSHSGFNAFRHHLLPYRSTHGNTLYREMMPNRVTARAILDGIRAGEFDVGPLDAYWHALIARHAPALTAGIRVIESTDTAPMPAFVAAASFPSDAIARLKAAFAAASTRPWFDELADPLGILGFAPVTHADFDVTVRWDQSARDAGYPFPA